MVNSANRLLTEVPTSNFEGEKQIRRSGRRSMAPASPIWPALHFSIWPPFTFRDVLHLSRLFAVMYCNCIVFLLPLSLLFAIPLLPLFVNDGPIPHICHGSHGYIRINSFWTVYIFTDLTRKFAIFDRF